MLKQRPREGKKILPHIEGTAANIEHDTQKSSSYSVSQLQIEYKGNLKLISLSSLTILIIKRKECIVNAQPM